MGIDSAFIGVGIYTVPESAKLSGVSAGRIRRWLRGYTYEYRGTARASDPVWQRQLPTLDNKLALGFQDLLEVRMVNAFRERGVSWPTLRAAAGSAQKLFGVTHPFSSRRFLTDGRSVFAEITDSLGETSLLDLVRTQYAFAEVLTPLLHGVEFDQYDNALRWWPLGLKRRVVIDPARSFGQPIVSREGVPTGLITQAYEAQGRSFATVARYYDIETRSVRDAVEFEQKLAA